jgi:hypothetical protein
VIWGGNLEGNLGGNLRGNLWGDLKWTPAKFEMDTCKI